MGYEALISLSNSFTGLCALQGSVLLNLSQIPFLHHGFNLNFWRDFPS